MSLANIGITRIPKTSLKSPRSLQSLQEIVYILKIIAKYENM